LSFVIKNFATIRLFVDDVAKSRDWYKSYFGIEPIEDIGNFSSFRIGQTMLDISVADDKSPLSQGGSVGYWQVDNLEQAVSHAIELGGQIYRGPLRVNEIQKTIVQILDPFGNVFGLEAAH
jgi:predicted enzyme related to lactoylglutathione lyase